MREEQRLAVLTAWPIDTLRANLSPETKLPELPKLVATGSPEDWMKRRPDIRSAERELAATYSDIGDEMAEYFPKITLLGGFGWTGQSSDSIGDDAAERWSYGPSISGASSTSAASTGTSRQPGATRRSARRLPGDGAEGARGPRMRSRLPRREPSKTNCGSGRSPRPGCAPRAQTLGRRRRFLAVIVADARSWTSRTSVQSETRRHLLAALYRRSPAIRNARTITGLRAPPAGVSRRGSRILRELRGGVSAEGHQRARRNPSPFHMKSISGKAASAGTARARRAAGPLPRRLRADPPRDARDSHNDKRPEQRATGDQLTRSA